MSRTANYGTSVESCSDYSRFPRVRRFRFSPSLPSTLGFEKLPKITGTFLKKGIKIPPQTFWKTVAVISGWFNFRSHNYYKENPENYWYFGKNMLLLRRRYKMRICHLKWLEVNIMRRFIHAQFGVCRKRFWCSPQLWRGQIKIIHMGA